MKNKLDIARQKMIDGSYTCFLFLGEKEYFSHDRGVKPLLSLLDSGESFDGFFAADKVVGQGAAHLYVLLGVKALWADVISEGAKQILTNNGVYVEYRECVPYVINRKKDGMCPIESAVFGIASPYEAHEIILKTLHALAESARS